MSKIILAAVIDAYDNYNDEKRREFYESIINDDSASRNDVNMLLSHFPSAMEEIMKDEVLCIKIIKKLILNHENTKQFIKLIQMALEREFIPNGFFCKYPSLSNNFIVALLNSSLLGDLIKKNKITVHHMLKLLQSSLTDLKKDAPQEFINQFINEMISFTGFKKQDVYNMLILPNPELIEKLNSESLKAMSSCLTNESFSAGKKNNLFQLNSELLIRILSSDIDECFLIGFFENIEKFVKMKDVLEIPNIRNIFLNNFSLFKKDVFELLCETKGATIAKMFFEVILNDITGNIQNKEFCQNFMILLVTAQSTVVDLIEKSKLEKDDIINNVKIMCKTYPEFVKIITLPLIDIFELYKYEIISAEQLFCMMFEALQNYKKIGNDESQLTSFSIPILETMLKSKINFVDSSLMLNFLSDVYSNHLESESELKRTQQMIEFIADELKAYNQDDVANALVRMITLKTTTKEFLEYYFKAVPEAKDAIVKKINKKIKMELTLCKFASDTDVDYEIESPLLQFYNTVISSKILNFAKISHNVGICTDTNVGICTDITVTNKNKEPTMLADCNFSAKDIDVDTIENMLTCKSYSDFKSEKMTCNICFENQVDIAINPCGHVMCGGCYTQLVHKKKCPLCSKDSVSMLKLYFW